MVDAVTFGGVRLSASMDVTSGKLLPTGQPGEYKAGGNYTLDDASPVYVEAILMPVGTAEGITVNVHVDGRDFTYALPPTHVWNPGMIYTYTLNMNPVITVRWTWTMCRWMRSIGALSERPTGLS